jgi:hypothetical protein
MLPGDGGPFGPPKAYHVPFRPIADPAAAARARERRRKMLALTKAAFPDLRVPTPFVSVRANETPSFPMPFVRASLVIEQYDKDDSCSDFFDTWCLWDTGAQSSMIPSRMLSKEVKGGGEEEGYASLVIRYASRRPFKDLLADRFSLDLLEHHTASRLRLALGRIYRTMPISLF